MNETVSYDRSPDPGGGHGNVDIRIRDGKVERCQWQVVEARGFSKPCCAQKVVRGRPRSVADLRDLLHRPHPGLVESTEAAMGVRVSEPVIHLRKLLLHAENIRATFCTSATWFCPICSRPPA